MTKAVTIKCAPDDFVYYKDLAMRGYFGKGVSIVVVEDSE